MGNTPYDDVFRTLLNDCPRLIIPVINEIFGECYSGQEKIRFSPNEHFLNQQDGKEKERITDTCFEIQDHFDYKYHLECQSTEDKSMLSRFFEYDTQIALDDGTMVGDVLYVSLPRAAILYLRQYPSVYEELRIQIETPEAVVEHRVYVMKVQTYTTKRLFEKKLLFLIPFHIFSYEKSFPIYEANEKRLAELEEEYVYIRNKLELLCEAGEIDEYTKCTIVDMSNKVLEHIAQRFEKVREGVRSVMGGRILEYEAKTIKNEGITQGISQGKMQTYLELMRDGLISAEEAARRLHKDMKELEVLLQSMK